MFSASISSRYDQKRGLRIKLTKFNNKIEITENSKTLSVVYDQITERAIS